MNNKQCLAKLDRLGVPHPKPGEPYTFFKMVDKARETWHKYNSLDQHLVWERGRILEEPNFDPNGNESCGHGLHVSLDVQNPMGVSDSSYGKDRYWTLLKALKREMPYQQLLQVYVMPEDVVCVPRNSWWNRTDKIRVRKLRVGPRVTYKDWTAVIVEEGNQNSARRQRVLDAKRRKVKS